MIIYRIEHSSGVGMFQIDSSENTLESVNYHNVITRHDYFRMIHEDFPNWDDMYDSDDWFCAYKSFEQMLDWVMEDEIKELITEHNFSVYEITPAWFMIGRDQVIFKKEDAEYFCLNELFL